jgi:hypothetical protein
MTDQIVEAINDLTRVTIALNGGFGTKSEAVRRMAALSIPSGRIAAILAMSQPDVASILSKEKKKKSKE